jgi:NitT/TauT family transport system substrate-binding protein
VTGVVSGQFDLGYTAWTPPLLAIAGQQPLRLVTGVAGIGPAGSNSLLLVRDDSGIESYADLTGKKVATNAPRSVLALHAAAATSADGGDGTTIEIVPLPFGEVARAVAEGAVDAGVTVEPFINAASTEYPNVIPLGDPGLVIQQERDPSTLIFTSADTLGGDKADTIARFKAAFAEAAAYANDNPDDVRRLGAEITGVPESAAALLPVSPFVPEIDPARLQPILDAMLEFAWVEEPIDLTAFLGG